MKIYGMRVNHLTDPVGFELKDIRFSYKVKDASGKKQQSARIVIAEKDKDIVFDSGYDTGMDSLCYAPKITLKPRTAYTWQVTVCTDAGEECTSDEAFFETGKMDEPWEAAWIMAAEKDGNAVFEKSFSLPERAVNARLYICGLGLYEAVVNGQRVGDEYLTPYCNDYDSWLQYQTFDITDLLGRDNTVKVSLGDGWYKGRFGFRGQKEIYGNRQAMICEIRARMRDGKEITIGTDETWRTMTGPVLFSNIYDGEIIDDTVAEKETGNAVKATQMMTERLTDRLSLPVRIVETLAPVDVIITPRGETVIDIGQNMTGWLAFRDKGVKGQKYHLSYGEVMQDGCFYRDNLRSAKAEFTYISDGVEKWVRPKFTFYGFRYIRIEGFDGVNTEDFRGEVICSDIRQTSSVTTGNKLADRFALNAVWGQRGNFVDVPTDCPQRDERMGWTGDAQVFCGTAMYQTDSAAFYTKFMRDMLMEQNKREGGVPHVIPAFELPCMPSCAWADAAAIIPWTLWTFYGDTELLRQQYANIRGWAEWIHRVDEATGGQRLWQAGFHFADWLALDAAYPASCTGGTDRDLIASCYYYYSTRLAEKAASVLHYSQDQALFGKRADEIRQAIRREYFTVSGKPAVRT